MRTASSAQRSRSSSLNRRRASNIARLIGIESTSQSNRAALFDIRRSLGNLPTLGTHNPPKGDQSRLTSDTDQRSSEAEQGAFEIVRLFELDDSLIEGLADRTAVSVNPDGRESAGGSAETAELDEDRARRSKFSFSTSASAPWEPIACHLAPRSRPKRGPRLLPRQSRRGAKAAASNSLPARLLDASRARDRVGAV
jgi:hypothetical protein